MQQGKVALAVRAFFQLRELKVQLLNITRIKDGEEID
jgi:hypothetical protein